MFKTYEQLMQPESVWVNIKGQTTAFLSVFAVVLGISYGLLMTVDFLPETPEKTPVVMSTEASVNSSESENDLTNDNKDVVLEEDNATSNADTAHALPTKITIDKLDKTISILNPETNRVTVLDAALQKGAVRHPDSADFVDSGNIFILGHSSRLPNVINKNYQAFNDIETLEWGDTIRVFSESREYIYRVDNVYEAKASEVVVPMVDTGNRLTLATCNSFGSRDDRFIVEATLQSQKAI